MILEKYVCIHLSYHGNAWAVAWLLYLALILLGTKVGCINLVAIY